MMTNRRTIPMAVLVAVLIAGATVSPATLAKTAGCSGPAPPIAGTTEYWWTAAQGYIEEDLGLA